ncbi:acetolactate decarboxylase [Rufibacter ruber]|uniref:acetolactate decarboxylase n=1 Tax=Rufibacter ruber TaxID=1783499 RepID=UPI001F4EDD9D|nr:acetolactate decarboxylase [Rufibacter ruber]
MTRFSKTLLSTRAWAGMLVLIISWGTCSSAYAQQVKLVGAMRNVMMKGQLRATVDLDTLSSKTHLFGLGPMENLAGEILVLDGTAYKATVQPDNSMKVEETFQLKAPFFGYATVEKWVEQKLPAKVQTLPQLEDYLTQRAANVKEPFFFKLEGMAEHATIHVVNLPAGTVVRSPKDAHQGQVDYAVANVPVQVLGFYSTAHKTIFTHHDTNLHLHLITADKQKMGHVDGLKLKKGAIKLYLPQTLFN